MSGAKNTAKKRKSRLISAGTAVIFLIFVVGAALAAHERLYIKEIYFYGNRHLSAEVLKGLMGCSEGSGFFSVSAADMHRGLLGSPWIKDAHVRKELTGRVDVYLTEAVAIGVLSLNDKSWLIDRSGVKLEEIKPERSYFLPVVKTDPEINLEAYQEAVILSGILYDRKELAKSGNTEISGSRPEEMILKIDDLTVKIGSGGFDEKLEKLNFARKEIEKRGLKVEYVDVRFADRIIVKPHRDSKDASSENQVSSVKARDREIKRLKRNSVKKRAGGKVKRYVG